MIVAYFEKTRSDREKNMGDGKLLMPEGTNEPKKRERNVIDVQVEEARALAKLEMELNRKFVGMPKDLRVWSRLRDELTTRAAELGFEIVLDMDVSGENWIPICNIVGRTDKRLQRILNEEGPDIERKAWDAKHTTSNALKEEGVNTELL